MNNANRVEIGTRASCVVNVIGFVFVFVYVDALLLLFCFVLFLFSLVRRSKTKAQPAGKMSRERPFRGAGPAGAECGRSRASDPARYLASLKAGGRRRQVWQRRSLWLERR